MHLEIVIINDDCFDEAIDQPFPIFLYPHIPILIQGVQDHFFANLGDLCFLFLDALDQPFFLSFQFFQTSLGGAGEHAFFDGLHEIVQSTAYILQLCLQGGNHLVSFLQQCDQIVSDGVDIAIIAERGHDHVDHPILDPILAESLAIAGMPFCSSALVIPIDHAVGLICAIADKHGVAGATEQLGGQNVGFRCLALALGVLILLGSHGNPLEQIFRNDGGNAVWNHYIPEFVFSDVLAIGKNARQGILVEAVAS